MSKDEMMRETKRKSDILSRWRKEYKCEAISLVGHQMQQPGLPDALVLYKGVHIWIEFKNPETPTRMIQTIIHGRFLGHGVKVWIVRFMTETEWVIENTVTPYSIKFSKVGEGVKELFRMLYALEADRIEKERSVINNFPVVPAPVISCASEQGENRNIL
jgi:hypothetical protein